MAFTTLSLALDAVQKNVNVASATGINLPANPANAGGSIDAPTGNSLTILYVDSEAMAVIRAGKSTTEFIVLRGWNGTKAESHLANAKVWVGTAQAFDVMNPMRLADWLRRGIGAAVASAATITASNPVFHVTGTTAINTINAPAAFGITGGQITIIPDALGSTGTSGNIALASTFVVNKALILTWDPVAAKWNPSY